jgi:hypothetical protein
MDNGCGLMRIFPNPSFGLPPVLGFAGESMDPKSKSEVVMKTPRA